MKMINWLSKSTFFAGSSIAFLSIFMVIYTQAVELGSETVLVSSIELVLIIIPKVLLVISAFFLFRRNENGLYVLYAAFFASAIHSAYVLCILESGKRYISQIQFTTGPYIYWVFKSFFYIIPLILYLVWIVYWSIKLKHSTLLKTERQNQESI